MYCLNLTEIIIAIIGAIGITSFITVKIVNRNSVSQRGNVIHGSGDVVGGDKTSGNKVSR
ncbi:MAG TPA: hypothetical protein VGD22_13345 [Sphingobacteriaceae bacterium]